MVYTGPSKGCQKCKSRHIKCDERKPFCGNCQRANLPCPGYTYEGGIRFQDETSLIIGRRRKSLAKRRRSPEKEPEPEPEPGASSSTASSRLPTDDLENTAIAFFLANFCQNAKVCSSTRGWFDLLPTAYTASAPDSALALVLATLAVELYLRWTGSEPDSERAGTQLGKALQAVNKALIDPRLSVCDETLKAVLLLQFHTNLIAHLKMEAPAGNHSGGATALIYHRGARNFTNETSKRLLQNTRYRLIWNALVFRTHLALEDEIWLEAIDSTLIPAARVDRIAMELANIQADFEIFKINSASLPLELQVPDYDTTALDAIKIRAKRVDDHLAQWASEQVGYGKFVSMSGSGLATPSLIEAGVFEDLWEVYPSIQVSDAWNSYRSYRLICLRILGQCNNLLSQSALRTGLTEFFEDYESNAEIGRAIREVVDGLCAAVPYSLGTRMKPPIKEDFDTVDGGQFLLPRVESDAFWGPTVSQRVPGSLMTREEHIRQLIADGPWYIVRHLDLAFQLASEVEEPNVIGPHLRAGQLGFIETQILRCNMLHRLEAPARQRQPSETFR